MHITHICPRFKEIHGGGEPVLFHLFQALGDLGVATTVHTCNCPDAMLPQFDRRTRMKSLPPIFNRTFGNVLLTGFFDLLSTCFLIAGIDPQTDVVCFHTENTIPALFLYKLLGGRKPTLYFCYQPPRFAYDTTRETARSGGILGRLVPLFKAIYKPFDRIAARQADRIATFSNGYKKWIEEIYRVRNVSVLPPGVDQPDKATPPSFLAKKLPGPHRVLVSVGKLVAWKNVDRLIDILILVKEKLPDVCLLIVGDGPCMPQLKRQTRELGLNNAVIFCGYVPANEVFAYCAAADILVLLEKNASFGLSLLEANATGLPVMAYAGGGPSDIIRDGENGFLLDEALTDRQIADRLCAYLDDPERIDGMCRHALSVAQRYTWKRFAELFAAVAQELAHDAR